MVVTPDRLASNPPNALNRIAETTGASRY